MQVIVLGFYSKANLGDELFKQAFQYLFPNLQFTFTDHLTVDLLKNKDILFIGGGSLLDGRPNITDGALKTISNMPIIYAGVGAETDIHPIHKQLIKQAKLVAIRSPNLDKIKALNKNAIQIPDLVYSLANQIKQNKTNKSILYVPNALVLPKWDDPHWKHVSWSFWKLEVAQTFDYLIEQGYTISSYPMSNNAKINDNDACLEVLNMMHNKDKVSQIEALDISNLNAIVSLFSRYSTIVSQRYHGIILAEMAGAPYLSIAHHDKLKAAHCNYGSFISYFETSKAKLLYEINNSSKQQIIPIDTNIFKGFVKLVNKCLDG